MTHFDDVLSLIGHFGPYQFLKLIGVSFISLFAAFQTVSVVFTAGQIDFWCADSNMTQSSASHPNMTNTCGANCSSWMFSSTGQFESSWRSAFGLVCSRENLVGLSATLYMLGFLFGSTAYGMLSDKVGRVPAASLAVMNTWLGGIAIAFSPRVEVYVALRLLIGFGASGILSVCNAFVSECVISKHRLLWLLIGSNGWTIGLCVMSVIAYFVRSHWKLELVLATPTVLGVVVLLLIGESPRWLLAKNRPDEAAAKCKRIAKINCRKPPANLLATVQDACEKLIEQQGDRPSVTIIDLLRSRMLRPTLLTWNCFFSSSMVYYGLIFSTGELKGSIFLIFLIGSALGVPASIFCAVTTWRFGRPLVFTFVYFMVGVCMIVIAVMWQMEEYKTVVVVIALIGRFFATVSFDLSWGYSSELFPTLVRNAGMGSASTAARVGGMLAPAVNMLASLHPALPFFIFAAVSFLASAATLLLPETRGARLPETLQQADKRYVTPKIVRLMRSTRL